MFVTIPYEARTGIKQESERTGKSVKQIIKELLVKNFSIEKKEKSPTWDEIFSIVNENPELHKSNGKWTRDELHRY